MVNSPRITVLLLISSLLSGQLLADDQFLCCMKGWKSVRDLMLCPAPCCPGYLEKVAYPRNLEPLVYCVKENPVVPFSVEYE